jgi:hypothetical protein
LTSSEFREEEESEEKMAGSISVSGEEAKAEIKTI